ncbi:unnamed protein product [Gordionus sp. m RMFG-2023]|uniref:uncharacterized protein LOC135925700 n=1 Tax=Gordionus sp. m RMFG-2023 TaxID=3053472 RepID=UPI0030DDE704
MQSPISTLNPILGPSSSSYAQIVAFCSLANFINSADRVVMPLAIVPMANQYGWSMHQKGLILSAFSFGFFTSQLAGAGAAPRYGAKRVLGIAVFIWSLSTFITPLVAHSLPYLIAARLLMGFGEGFGLPAVFHVYSTTLLPGERSRAFGYLVALGSVGQCTATLILPHAPWSAAFYLLGVVGFLWVLAWVAYYRERRSVPVPPAFYSTPSQYSPLEGTDRANDANNSVSVPLFAENREPNFDPVDNNVSNGNNNTLLSHYKRTLHRLSPPCVSWWLPYLDKPALWAIYAAHFAMNWCSQVVALWLPTYLTTALGADPDHLSLTALPYAFNSLAGAAAGHWADSLLARRGKSLLYVRRLATAIGLLIPAACLIILAAARDPVVAILLMSLAMAGSAFNSCGHLANHADLAPRRAGATFAVANTLAALPGMICGPLTAELVHAGRGRWFPVFWIAGLINVLAAVVYLGNSKASPIL